MREYFTAVKTAEELKKAYFALAKKHHSDITGGSDEIMKAINCEYDEMFSQLKDVHASFAEDDKTYTAKAPTAEAPADFRNIIAELLRMGLDVELCGRWIWIGGDTKPHKDTLKAIGCRWSSQKKLWSWHFPEEQSYHRKAGSSMAEIRRKYGSTSFGANDNLYLPA